jgi:hypothetical protein
MTINNQDLLLLIGRPNRKLRGFVPEIKEWHAQGISVRAMHRMLQLRGETADYQSVYREVQKIKATTLAISKEPAISEVVVETDDEKKRAEAIAKGVALFDELVAKGIGNPLFKKTREREEAAARQAGIEQKL